MPPFPTQSVFLKTFNIDTRLRSRAAGGGSKSPSLIAEDSSNMDLNGGNQFESLKREANKLERQLEEKVARYQQVRTVPLRR